MSEEKKLNGTVIVTYRCNARCSMCNRYKAPSKPEEEISIETIRTQSKGRRNCFYKYLWRICNTVRRMDPKSGRCYLWRNL